jgi:hypothetical protein
MINTSTPKGIYRSTRQAIWLLIVLSVAVSCRQHADNDVTGMEQDAWSPLRYHEDDTLALGAADAPNLKSWIGYYHTTDTAFDIGRFRASGVNLHIDSFETIDRVDVLESGSFGPILAYSPDSSLALDIWSYNHIVSIRNGQPPVIEGGGPEQQISLIDLRTGLRRQVLYNGSAQVVETADWMSDDVFVLGMMNINESTGVWSPDILLFSMKDSICTNFRYTLPLVPDGIGLPDGDFMTGWLKRKGYKKE